MKKVTDAEWQQILAENPTNTDLCYIIEYTDKKDEAWAQLLKQNPTNEDLRYIIAYSDKKEEAWLQLLKQNPTNAELCYIIRYTDKKEEAQAILDSRMASEKPKEKKGKMIDIIKARN